jgi:hypothetical protein
MTASERLAEAWEIDLSPTLKTALDQKRDFEFEVGSRTSANSWENSSVRFIKATYVGPKILGRDLDLSYQETYHTRFALNLQEINYNLEKFLVKLDGLLEKAKKQRFSEVEAKFYNY